MKRLKRKELRNYAKMAAQSYVDDPVHAYATKTVWLRKKFVYHFMIERLSTSNREDIFYIDEENRGLCIWREATNPYTMFDFLLCPNWIFLMLYPISLIKTLKAYAHLDEKVFPENTLIISPVFVDTKHQGKGVASKLIRRGIDELAPKGYKLGLETQNPDNVGFYERLGFKILKHEYWESEKIHNYYMIYS